MGPYSGTLADKIQNNLISNDFQGWFEDRFKCELEVAHGFSLPKVPEQAKQAVGNYLKSYDRGSLLALEQMCLAFKSIMISIMVIERKLDVEEALKLRYISYILHIV